MNIDQLKYFADLASTNSINTTSKRMFISQQALSKSIKRLENELDCTLINRSKTGIEFTDDGLVILEYAKNILEQHDCLKQYLLTKYNKNYLQGKIIIGVAPMTTNIILPKLLLKMHQYYPDITIYSQERTNNTILKLLNNMEIDFGFLGLFKSNFDAFLISQQIHANDFYIKELYSDPLVCVMSKNNPLSTQKSLTLDNLKILKQTIYGDDAKHLFENNCFHVSNNTEIHQQFMLEEGTVCSIPRQTFLRNYAPKGFIAIPISDAEPVMNYLFFRKKSFLDNEKIYQTFIETALSLIPTLQ